jgi:hypothetical protein
MGLFVWAAFVGCTGGETADAPPPTPEHAPEPVVAPAPAPAPSVAPVPAGARVFFVEPAEGAKVPSPVTVKFGIEGMEVKPAGDLTPNSGHHHLIVNAEGVQPGQQVPKDDKHIHYGQGQTEAQVELAPGEYALTMQFADASHLSYGPQLATTIHITVE